MLHTENTEFLFWKVIGRKVPSFFVHPVGIILFVTKNSNVHEYYAK